MKSHFKKYPEVSEDTKEEIIKKWRFSKLNSTTTIAADFNIPISQVNKIINDYLSTKCRFQHNN